MKLEKLLTFFQYKMSLGRQKGNSQMQVQLDEKDYQLIAAKVLDIIKQKYDLVPQQPKYDNWVGSQSRKRVDTDDHLL